MRPSLTTKDGTVVRFFAKKNKHKEEKNDESPIKVECIDSRGSLLNHRFFRMMRSTQTAGFFQLSDSNYMPQAKDNINLVFLRDCKFKIFKDGMTEFVEKVEKLSSEKEREDIVQHFPSVVSDLIAMYESMSKSLKITLPDGEVLYGVPSIYMFKFNKWHSEHTAMCLESINDVLSDKLYEDWYAQLRSCLDFLYVAFELTISDAKLTLKDLNGDLDKEIADILASMHR